MSGWKEENDSCNAHAFVDRSFEFADLPDKHMRGVLHFFLPEYEDIMKYI